MGLFENMIEDRYPIYSLLDAKHRRMDNEIAKKFPYSIEHVASVLIDCECNQEKAERKIMHKLATKGI